MNIYFVILHKYHLEVGVQKEVRDARSLLRRISYYLDGFDKVKHTTTR